MHPEVETFIKIVKSKYPESFHQKKVLEVGSLDINGSIRGLFSACYYTGLDVGEGKGVDVVCPIHQYILPEEFDVVVSTEMLEHDKYWEDSLRSMYSNLKVGGLLILTCAGPTRQSHGFQAHTPQDSPFTNDYYRNISIEDFSSILPHFVFNYSNIAYSRGEADLYFYGIKA